MVSQSPLLLSSLVASFLLHSCWLQIVFGSVSYVSFEINDHDGRRGDMAQELDPWRHPVASSEAPDVFHSAMRSAS